MTRLSDVFIYFDYSIKVLFCHGGLVEMQVLSVEKKVLHLFETMFSAKSGVMRQAALFIAKEKSEQIFLLRSDRRKSQFKNSVSSISPKDEMLKSLPPGGNVVNLRFGIIFVDCKK